jgi:hypothetical protein
MISKEYKEQPEYVKSGYLYRLTSFIEWPQTVFNFSLTPFIIGLFGQHDIDSALFNMLRDKRIKDRDWKVEYFKSPHELRHCHLLFIKNTSGGELQKLLIHLSNKRILTVGDNLDQFCQKGGMINLVGTNPNFGYEVNTRALEYAGLTVNKDFIELATVIE